MQKTAIIIGAGPAGLTAAFEMLDKTDIKPIILEATDSIGGISQTVNHNGNKIDIGGHRFFSKSDRVMNWWQTILPLQGHPSHDDIILNRRIPLSTSRDAPDPEKSDRVMLIRHRVSRILYLGKFFSYPITLSFNTLMNLGLLDTMKVGLSYFKTKLFPLNTVASLEDFFISRFGRHLYETFFKSYTEKVWGVPCSAIKPEWGSQRIKGLSIITLLLNMARQALSGFFSRNSSIDQKQTETSLIERFMYPKFGPGQMWEEVARIITSKGGELYINQNVVGCYHNGTSVTAIDVRDVTTDTIKRIQGDYFFSTMPVKDLISSMGNAVPATVAETAQGLQYRDFITVGLLLKKLKIRNTTKEATINNIIPDNWIYVQEIDVKIGRIQVFNNWSPYLVKNPDTVWIGLEYFCTEGDMLWEKSDSDFCSFACDELEKIGIIDRQDILDNVVIRIKKAYPAYFGTYDSFSTIREYIDRFTNLYLIGRNGMHRYNNQDHSMLTAMVAVNNIINGVSSKKNIWEINTEDDYHESA